MVYGGSLGGSAGRAVDFKEAEPRREHPLESYGSRVRNPPEAPRFSQSKSMKQTAAREANMFQCWREAKVHHVDISTFTYRTEEERVY